MSSYEYNQLLKFLYFEGYADSYAEAEELLESMSDEEFEEIIEASKEPDLNKMKRQEYRHSKKSTSQRGGGRGDARNRAFKMSSVRDALERGEDPRADTYGGAQKTPIDHRASFSKNPLNNPPRRVKEPGVKKEEYDNLTERMRDEPDEAEQLRQSDMIARDPRVKAEREASRRAAQAASKERLKKQGLKRKDGTPVFEEVVEYLFVEGFADTIENAEVMAENISEQWIDEILNEMEVQPPKEPLKTDRNMFNIPADEKEAARERTLAKAKAMRAKKGL
jgi:hypothetical protein